MDDPYAWPAITADTLRAGLAATRTADDKAALAQALTTCHSCDTATTTDDTCADCLNDCLCLSCRELRQVIAEDRAVELERMAWGEDR